MHLLCAGKLLNFTMLTTLYGNFQSLEYFFQSSSGRAQRWVVFSGSRGGIPSLSVQASPEIKTTTYKNDFNTSSHAMSWNYPLKNTSVDYGLRYSPRKKNVKNYLIRVLINSVAQPIGSYIKSLWRSVLFFFTCNTRIIMPTLQKYRKDWVHSFPNAIHSLQDIIQT